MLVLSTQIGNIIRIKGKKFDYFGGNNYLGLAGHPDMKKACIASIRKYGVNFAASRRTTGTAEIHLELESALSAFKGSQDTVVFSSGYQGNNIVLEVLRTRYTAVFADRLAHPSITGGLPRDVTNIQYYDHCDAGHLEELLQQCKPQCPLFITDGIFALTGEIAPLDKLYGLVQKYRGILVVDDAHATGILGNNGRGTPAHFNLDGARDIFQTETMSKALGGYGGFISGSSEFITAIRNTSPVYQASTALPPSVVAAGIASLKIIRDNPGYRIRVLEMAARLRQEIIRLGFQSTGDSTPIIPVIMKEPDMAGNLSAFLEDKGIIVPFIEYPVKHAGALIRISVSAMHTAGQLEKLIGQLRKWKEEQGKDCD
jgi:7-keto-8-aminopelargonate synthetase-like enzyme